MACPLLWSEKVLGCTASQRKDQQGPGSKHFTLSQNGAKRAAQCALGAGLVGPVGTDRPLTITRVKFSGGPGQPGSSDGEAVVGDRIRPEQVQQRLPLVRLRICANAFAGDRPPQAKWRYEGMQPQKHACVRACVWKHTLSVRRGQTLVRTREEKVHNAWRIPAKKPHGEKWSLDRLLKGKPSVRTLWIQAMGAGTQHRVCVCVRARENRGARNKGMCGIIAQPWRADLAPPNVWRAARRELGGCKEIGRGASEGRRPSMKRTMLRPRRALRAIAPIRSRPSLNRCTAMLRPPLLLSA